MEKLELTSVKIEDTYAIIETLYTKQTVCTVPTNDINKAFDFALALEHSNFDGIEIQILKNESDLLLDMCGDEPYDKWLKNNRSGLNAS